MTIHTGIVRALIHAGGRMPGPLPLAHDECDPDALSFLLDTPGCMSIENAENLRRQVLDSSDARLEPLRQRLKLRDAAAVTCPPAGLEMP